MRLWVRVALVAGMGAFAALLIVQRASSSVCTVNQRGPAAGKVGMVIAPPVRFNASAVAMEDILGHERPLPDGEGVHFIYQLPLELSGDPATAHLLADREREYAQAVGVTLRHPNVAAVHLLTETVTQQARVYALFPSELHHKMRSFNLNRRMTYADAVSYANRKLAGRVVAISTADTSAVGPEWARLTRERMRGTLFGLSRHERPGCAMTCDCLQNFDGCHDTFVFLAPLQGGDAMLEQISFRLGGLWGSENRFLWEAQAANPSLRISNPCKTVRMEHSHCIAKGAFRPSQDQRRVNLQRSLAPGPGFL